MAIDNIELFAKEGAEAGACYEAFARAFRATTHLPAPEVYNGAFLAYYSHALDLAFDKYGIPQESDPVTACALCKCDTCGKLNDCTMYPKTDGITPPPCAECSRFGCVRPLMPVCDEHEPDPEQ